MNLGYLDFEIVSDFDIRISDFNHSGCFMQNKPNFLNAQMNATSLYTKDYENKRLADAAKTNPIQSQYKPNTNPIQTQYKPNTNPTCSELVEPIPEMPKMNENLFATKVYENITTFRLEQNKPKQTQYKPNSSDPPAFYSLSNKNVTGPSLMLLTRICSPKAPFSTATPCSAINSISFS